MKNTIIVQTPIGHLEVTAGHRDIISVRVVSGRGRGHTRVIATGTAPAARLARDLGDYFQGRSVDFSGYRLDLAAATPFQIAVWKAARRIRCGRVLSYGQLAQAIGKPRAARAVGNALHANPFLIVVPCHRVVRGDGTLGGFGAGMARKERLLGNEGWRIPGNRRRTRKA